MPTEVIMPKMGLNMKEGVLTEWLVEHGERVQSGQPLFVVETEKITNEITAEADGILHHTVQPGTSVPVLGVLGYILAEGEQVPAAGSPPESTVRTHEPIARPSAPSPSGRVLASPKAKRRAKELDIDLQEVTGTGRDGQISAEDVEAFVAQRKAAPAPKPVKIKATPVAKRLAKELGVDLATIVPSDPNGKITKEDVERAATAATAREPIHGEAGSTIPLTGVRSIIAQRMHLSAQTTAPVTLVTEVDATNLVQARTAINQARQTLAQPAISYNALLVKLVGLALAEFPYLNASLSNDAIELKDEINVGVAVDLERGLLVPVIHDVDRLSIEQINVELNRLVEWAQAGKLTPDDLEGGTFTITNLGNLGIDAFTPIINHPEAAILGVGRIVEKPVVIDGGIHIRHRVVLSLTFDHRIVDGAPAARFLQKISEQLEALDPGARIWQ